MKINTHICNKELAIKVLKACIKRDILVEFIYGHPTIRMNWRNPKTKEIEFAPHLVMEAIYHVHKGSFLKKAVTLNEKFESEILQYLESDESKTCWGTIHIMKVLYYHITKEKVGETPFTFTLNTEIITEAMRRVLENFVEDLKEDMNKRNVSKKTIDNLIKEAQDDIKEYRQKYALMGYDI